MPEKKKLPVIVTPAGIAKFPWLNTPDVKFSKAGKFKVDLVLDPEQDKAFLDSITKLAEKAKADFAASDPKTKNFALHVPIIDETDKDGNETGKKIVRLSANASFEDKKTNQVIKITIPIFDSKKQQITAKVGGGSKIKVAFNAVPFAMKSTKNSGVNLRIKGVQVLDLKEWNGQSAESMGFGEEEGFAAENVPAGESTEVGAEASQTSEDGDY